MAQLVRRSLRMNASRVIVGEVLGDEVVPMLNAMSQGRSGSMATIHADDSAGVFRRLAAYAIQAPERLPLEATNLLIAGAIHLVVHLDTVERPFAKATTGPFDRGGHDRYRLTRHVASVREVVGADGALIVTNEVWKPGPDGCAVPAAPLRDATAALLRVHGYEPSVTRTERGLVRTALLVFVASVGGAGLCLVIAGLSRTTIDRVPRPAHSPALTPRRLRYGTVAAGAGVVAYLVTGWPVAIPLGALGVLGVRGLGRGPAGQVIERIEAIASWTEMLRDTLAGAAGLTQALIATAPICPRADPRGGECPRESTLERSGTHARRCAASPTSWLIRLQTS